MRVMTWLGSACVVVGAVTFVHFTASPGVPDGARLVHGAASGSSASDSGIPRRAFDPALRRRGPGVPTPPSGGTRVLAATVPASLANQILDVYDPSTRILTIPLAQFKDRYYRDLQVRLSNFNPVVLGPATATSGVFDRFDASATRLTVPVLRSGATLYYNNSFEVERVLNVPARVDSFTVPLDLASVSYPASYQTVTTDIGDVNTDPCNLTLSRITYPASWLGQYPLPPVAGAPLAPSIGRAVMLKDVGLAPATNPVFILPNAPGAPTGCTGNLQSELAKTLQRLRVLGTDQLEVTQWHWASAHPDGSWFFTPAETTYGSITDADLAQLVQKAHAQGIKVIMKNQIQGFLDDPNSGSAYQPAFTQANYDKWFAAYNVYILERAGVFQTMGLDMWEVGCSSCLFGDSGDGSAATASYFLSQYQLVLDNMKSAYSGKTLMYNDNPLFYQTPAFASRIDVIGFGFQMLVPPDPTAALSVAGYKTVIASELQRRGFFLFDPLGKTYLLDIGIQSRRNMFTLPGYMEETSCTPGVGVLNSSGDACVEREAIPDLSMQAIVIEATLEAIAEFPWKSPLIVAAGDYWETDSLMPFTAFPEIASTVRNKPAEGILKAWFTR